MRLHVVHVCEKYSHNITKAANALGVSRNTVRKYLEYIVTNFSEIIDYIFTSHGKTMLMCG